MKKKSLIFYIHKSECFELKFTQNITRKISEKSQEITRNNIIEINQVVNRIIRN